MGKLIRLMSLCDSLTDDAVSSLRIKDPIRVSPDQSIRDVIGTMQQAERGCAVVTEHGKPIGVFTERDIVTRILGKNVSLDTKIADVMTTQPKLVRDGCSLPEVIRVMHEGGFRHLPVVDAAGSLTGLISVRGIVEYMVEHFPAAVFNLPPDPNQKQVSREGA